MYQTMKIESLSRMIPFFEFSVVERISVDAVKNNFLALKVDHMKGIVMFDNTVSLYCAFKCCVMIHIVMIGEMVNICNVARLKFLKTV